MTSESTNFLYPFIDSEEDDPEALLKALEDSARGKAAASFALRESTLAFESPQLAATASLVAERFRKGGRLFAFGNGGSSTDAATLVRLFSQPPTGIPLPARHLGSDYATVSALSNDIGYGVVFSRQLIAHATANDIAIGFSTSGNSENLLTAFQMASEAGLLTIGFAGYNGGQMGTSPYVERCLTVRSDSVHRIQEVQAALAYALWELVQEAMNAEVA